MLGVVLLALAIVLFAGAHLIWRYAIWQAEQRRVGERLNAAMQRRAPAATSMALGLKRSDHFRYLPQSWTVLLVRAGLAPSVRLYLKIGGPITTLFIVALLYLGGLGGLVILALSVVLLYFWLWWRADKRQRQMITQLPDFLENIVRLISIGSSIGSAFHRAAEVAPEPLRPILAKAVGIHRSGVQLDEALRGVAVEYALHELFLVSAIIGVATRFGGRSDYALERMVTFIRDRENARDELQALSSEVRLSAWVLGLLPVVLGGYIIAFNASLLTSMWDDSTGKKLLIFAVLLQLGGSYWLYRMAREV